MRVIPGLKLGSAGRDAIAASSAFIYIKWCSRSNVYERRRGGTKPAETTQNGSKSFNRYVNFSLRADKVPARSVSSMATLRRFQLLKELVLPPKYLSLSLSPLPLNGAKVSRQGRECSTNISAALNVQ